jgi:hypothetical protein
LGASIWFMVKMKKMTRVLMARPVSRPLAVR